MRSRRPPLELPGLALSLSLLALVACARDARQVAWDDAFGPERRPERLLELAAEAPRANDAGAALLEAGRRLREAGRELEAARVFSELAEGAARRADRARGHYELGRMAEGRGQREAAQRIYRGLVRTYPDLMPGERGLAHLLRMARDEGPAAVDRHLAWTRSLEPILVTTALADDLVFQAADEARRRAAADPTPARWALAEELFLRLGHGNPGAALWNDAWWELSRLYHQQRRFPDEIAAIRRILRTREEVSLFGQNEHPYFYLGLRRVARLQLVELDDPLAAAATLLAYAALYPRSILRDDMRYFALCARLRAGLADATTDALEALLLREHPDSKYLRRLPLAKAEPRGPHCVPPEVE